MSPVAITARTDIRHFFGEPGEAVWRGLLAHVDLTQGFALFLVLLPGKAAWAICEQELAAHLLAQGKALRRLHYDSPEALVRLPNEVMSRGTTAEVGAVWIDLLGPDGHSTAREPWESATRRALALLNQHRNRLVQELPMPVFFVAEPWLKSAFREVAPDLWSIRVSVVQLQPTSHPGPRPDSFKAVSIPSMPPGEAAADPDYALQQSRRLEGQPHLLAARVDLLVRASGGFYRQGRPRFPMALAAAQEAVSFCREAAASTVDTLRPQLAAALNNLAVLLSEMGRRKEALPPAQEAADLYRVIARHDPKAFGPALAGVLGNLAIRLSEVGREAEALGPAQEAVDLHRALAEQSPESYRAGLASSLNTLANVLSGLGQRAEALATAQETAQLYRTLARENPEAFGPALAGSLNNLAIRLSEVGRHAEALDLTQEAVALRRTLASRSPEVFGPKLATSLNNLANSLGVMGRHTEALATAQEAVQLRRALTRQNPDAFGPDLASSLHNVAVLLIEMDRWAEAFAPAQEAAILWRSLMQQNPDAFAPDLVRSLGTVAQALEVKKRPDEALLTYAEAIRVLTPLLQSRTEVHAPLAQTLANDYLRLTQELGKEPDEALLAPIAEALQQADAAALQDAPTR